MRGPDERLEARHVVVAGAARVLASAVREVDVHARGGVAIAHRGLGREAAHRGVVARAGRDHRDARPGRDQVVPGSAGELLAARAAGQRVVARGALHVEVAAERLAAGVEVRAGVEDVAPAAAVEVGDLDRLQVDRRVRDIRGVEVDPPVEPVAADPDAVVLRRRPRR